ncbi:MAG: PfkB family carbohydrate kinase [Anaerolineaceae bacterium]|nr:PfkB family carbohydrate kinase [Anaerolineaceae bacterium]
MDIDFVAFGIIIDDIVFSDGRTEMGVLGGGGPQAAFGMRLWADRVGLVSGAGKDLPETVLPWCEASGIDTAGIRITDYPTVRAWQVTENGSRRTQVLRVSGEAVGGQLGRSLEVLPENYRQARGFHYGFHPEDPPEPFNRELHNLGKRISVEPFKNALKPLSEFSLRTLFESIDIFSPNLNEARSMLGLESPEALVRRFSDLGVRTLALRMGAAGSLVYSGKSKAPQYVPAVPTQVVDPVGAGNAYCGGFLVGWLETGDGLTAGRWGSVAASFLVEQVGVPIYTPERKAEAQRRLHRLLTES